MIKSFGGENCWCFNEPFEIDLSINNNVPNEYGFSDIGVLPVMCFIGANASGKTNALRCLAFIREFCTNSFYATPGKPIEYYSFFSNDKQSKFYINFYLGNDYEKEYKYELVLDMNKVYSEKISLKSSKEKKILIKRTNNKITINNLFKDNTIKIRNNASIISTFHQQGISGISDFYDFFDNIESNVTLYKTYNEPEEEKTSRYYYNHEKMLKKVINEISKFDTGITNIKADKFEVPEDDKNRDFYMSIFTHDVTSKINTLPIYMQSTGTRTLYTHLPEIISTLEKGGVLIFDEIDCHLHHEISLELINYFMDKNVNIHNAQLIFTTHDQKILDKLKKYYIYIFNKVKGESFCYRIDEIKDKGFIRNDKSLQSVYASGLLGGLPNVKKD